MRWISSTKSTSRSSSPVRIAAMSPLRSSAGPATVRMPTPSSSRTICASVVLPSPGGPTSSTWSSASPRAFAAASAIASCSLTLSWPTKSSRRRGRSERSSSSSSGSTAAAVTAFMRRLPQRQPDALLGGQLGIDARERLLGLEHRVAELDERVAGGDVADGSRRDRDRRHVLGAELALQLEHDPLGRLLADAGDRLEAGDVLERDRAAQLARARSPRRSRARPSGRCRSR